MAECRGFKNKLGTTIVSLIAKVTGAIAGNIATFNSDGELVDSGKALNSLVEKSGSAFAGNIASFGSNGVIVDSARPVSSLFAKIGASFTVGNIAVFDKQPLTNIVGIKDSGKSVDTNVTSGSSNLITSGAVYNGLQDRPSRKEAGQTVHSMLVLVKSSYPTTCQGQITDYSFKEYIETYSDANGRLWTIYLWSDGGADFFTVSSPANLAVQDRIYKYTQQSIAAIKNNTQMNVEDTLSQFAYDEVGNI